MKDLIKFNSVRGIFLVLVAVGALIYINETSNYLDPSTAAMPRAHLAVLESALSKHDLKTSFDEVNLAIEAMNDIENYSDSIAMHYIEKSISELELLKNEIIKDSVDANDLRHAFYETMNAMAYTNLRLAELRLEEGRRVGALEYFKISFAYLKKSMNYADEVNKQKEEKLLEEMRVILHQLKAEEDFEGFDYDKINEEMEQLM